MCPATTSGPSQRTLPAGLESIHDDKAKWDERQLLQGGGKGWLMLGDMIDEGGNPPDGARMGTAQEGMLRVI